jgi:hypothetical protein
VNAAMTARWALGRGVQRTALRAAAGAERQAGSNGSVDPMTNPVSPAAPKSRRYLSVGAACLAFSWVLGIVATALGMRTRFAALSAKSFDKRDRPV